MFVLQIYFNFVLMDPSDLVISLLAKTCNSVHHLQFDKRCFY